MLDFEKQNAIYNAVYNEAKENGYRIDDPNRKFFDKMIVKHVKEKLPWADESDIMNAIKGLPDIVDDCPYADDYDAMYDEE